MHPIALMADAEAALDRIERAIAEGDRIAITHILLTHHHGDHLAGLAEVRERAGSPPVVPPP